MAGAARTAARRKRQGGKNFRKRDDMRALGWERRDYRQRACPEESGPDIQSQARIKPLSGTAEALSGNTVAFQRAIGHAHLLRQHALEQGAQIGARRLVAPVLERRRT